MLLWRCVPLQPDLRLAMEYANNASNSYGTGDTMSASLANMSINDQHHQENGVQMGHRSPGDAKMKGQTQETQTNCCHVNVSQCGEVKRDKADSSSVISAYH